jgi:hypothetical protein
MVVIEDVVDEEEKWDIHADADGEKEISKGEVKEKEQCSSSLPAKNGSDSKEITTPKEGLNKLCGFCGLPARIHATTGHPIPLKRCSVCQQTWYHDRDCQKKHFPHHKKVCQRVQQKKNSTSKKKEEEMAACCVEVRPYKGRCVLANQQLPYGTVIGPAASNSRTNKSSDDSNHWSPIVAPVLLDNHRWHRCVVCFKQIILENQQQYQQQQITFKKRQGSHYAEEIIDPFYPARICSDACQRVSASFLPAETQAIATLKASPPCPPMILPTAILLYRLIRAIEKDTSGTIRSCMEQLQSEKQQAQNENDCDHEDFQQEHTGSTSNSSSSEEEAAHAQAVVATTWAMMRASSLPLWKLEDVEALLRQVKLNGFSICSAENVALGIGIYIAMTAKRGGDPSVSSCDDSSSYYPLAPNYFNHDCQPNILQTFDYGIVGQLPTLRLTVCVDGGVAPQQELTLSYIDHTAPTKLRHEQLWRHYGFVCRCPACQDKNDDVRRVIGYKCPRCYKSSQGLIQFPSNRSQCQCDKCETMVSCDVQDKLLQSFQFVGNNDGDSTTNIQALYQAYESLKHQCIPSSWYVRECGEKLLQALLDALGSCVAEQDQQQQQQKQYAIAAQAFQLTEELLAAANSTEKKNSSMLRDTLLRYKSIKLRLFLNVHPGQAMQELEQRILPTFATFFPNHHEIMQQIVQDCCL